MATVVPRRRVSSSSRIAIGFVAILGGAFFAYRGISGFLINGEKFSPLKPGQVCVVGINPGSGYRIIVANQIAQLSQGSAQSFEGNFSETASDSNPKRIPLKEMLQAMQGNAEALGRFVQIMNDLHESDIPEDLIWNADDLQKALSGDAVLKKKLVEQLSVDLDGTPLMRTSLRSIENGIGVRLPVTVNILTPNGLQPLTGSVVQEYRPRFSTTVAAKLEEKFDRSAPTIAGYWKEEYDKLVAAPANKEDVGASLRDRLSERRRKDFAKIPQQVLKDAFIVITDAQMEKASFEPQETPDGKKNFNITVDLNDEGRKRLWQFSRQRVGDQLLLVMDGIAIAAPAIEHELAQGEVTITKVPDEGLVQEFVDLVNQHGDKKN